MTAPLPDHNPFETVPPGEWEATADEVGHIVWHLDADGESIRVPTVPWLSASILGGAEVYVNDVGMKRPDADGRARSVNNLNGLRVDCDCAPRTTTDAAIMGMAAMLTDLAHELLEFTRVDGQTIAVPHGGGGAWTDFLMEEFTNTLRKYVECFPNSTP